MKRPDHVLAAWVVDCGLTADRRVDLCEERRRRLDKRHTALVSRRSEACEISDDPAAQRDDGRPAVAPMSQQLVEHDRKRSPFFVLLAVWHGDTGYAERQPARARSPAPQGKAGRPSRW